MEVLLEEMLGVAQLMKILFHLLEWTHTLFHNMPMISQVFSQCHSTMSMLRMRTGMIGRSRGIGPFLLLYKCCIRCFKMRLWWMTMRQSLTAA